MCKTDKYIPGRGNIDSSGSLSTEIDPAINFDSVKSVVKNAYT